MLWQYILPTIFITGILIQLIYILFIFTRLIRHHDLSAEYEGQKFPGVSIIVAAWNELHNLKELLPILDAQDYPNFEIIIVDDRSSDGTYDYLLMNEGNFKNLHFVRIQHLPDHFTAKKYAVTMAIKKSTKEIILTTDADCRPTSNQWIKKMVAQLTPEKDVVVGFSPYFYYKGNLNALIRYETFQTAVQYLSFALANMPFMGVGRNMLYRKSIFWKNNGFQSHIGLLSGDDDLFINEVARKDNVAICISEEARTVSEPKRTWDEWITQKRRHLSVGKRYKLKNKLSIGLLWISQLTSWLLAIPVFFLTPPEWFEAPEWSRIPAEWLAQYHLQHWLPYNDWMRLITAIFVCWLLIKWLILSKINDKLGKTFRNIKIPKFDLLYTIYLVVFGIITLVSNPKKIKWR